MRDSALTPAHQTAMGGAAIRLAAICLAGIGLTACGNTADKAASPSATSAGTSSASTGGSVPARPPESAGGDGAYCDVYRDQGAKLLLLHNASREADPAKVKADFDSVVAVYQALADAAPPELRADAELLLRTYKEDREEIAQAGWKPLAMVNTLADDLQDDGYVNAAAHQMTYLQDVCHIDPTKPKAAQTSGS
jgi:hypothetical protein